MANEEITKYIKDALASGATKGIVKSSLLGAGWQETDVDEAFKNIEGESAKPMSVSSGVSTMSQSPVSSQPMQSKSTTSGTVRPGGGSILSSLGRDSRIVSMPGGSAPVSQGAPRMISSESLSSPVGSKPSVSPQMSSSQISPVSMRPENQQGFVAPSRKWLWVSIGLGVLCLILLGVTVFLYSSSSGKVEALNTENTSLKVQLVSLNNELQAARAENETLKGQAATLTENVLTELSFYVAVPSLGNATVPRSVSVNGKVSGGNGALPFTITTEHGIVLAVANSSVSGVRSVLTPLVSQSAKVAGTYTMGSRNFTITAVNDAPIVTTPATSTTPTAQ